MLLSRVSIDGFRLSDYQIGSRFNRFSSRSSVNSARSVGRYQRNIKRTKNRGLLQTIDQIVLGDQGSYMEIPRVYPLKKGVMHGSHQGVICTLCSSTNSVDDLHGQYNGCRKIN